jgi:hypothetical protein
LAKGALLGHSVMTFAKPDGGGSPPPRRRTGVTTVWALPAASARDNIADRKEMRFITLSA